MLDQFENRVSVVLCHAKVSRASVETTATCPVSLSEAKYPRDKCLFAAIQSYAMNAFWNSFETLLGLGVEPRNLTFVQISLRGIIVFLVTLVAVRLGHKRSLSRKTPFDAVLLVILAAVLSRAINGSAAFSRRSAAAWFWSCSIAFSPFSHSIPIGSGSWSKAGLMSSCAMDNAIIHDVAQPRLNA
mgnify:CR=1 FL=1